MDEAGCGNDLEPAEASNNSNDSNYYRTGNVVVSKILSTDYLTCFTFGWFQDPFSCCGACGGDDERQQTAIKPIDPSDPNPGGGYGFYRISTIQPPPQLGDIY